MGNWHFQTVSRAVGVLLSLVISTTPAWAESHEKITVSHGISTFGELKYPPDFPHFDYVNPDAPKGGTISFQGTGASRTFDSLNPFILKGEAAQGLGRLFDSLLVRAYDEPDASYGLLAETLEYPDDRSWVIFNLRPEARFSDGEPVTAEDVVFTIDTLKADGSPLYRLALSDVEGAEALGPHRVKVTFAEGASTRDLPAEVGSLEILPKHYYETVTFNESTLEPPVGSGPFLVRDVDTKRSITYCRNPDYWGVDLPVSVGMNNFDCVVYEYFLDNTAAFEALKSGEYLFHEEFSSLIWATGYEFPAITSGWVKREVLEDQRSSGAQGFWLNMRREKLQDQRVREAIGLMFNFEWSNETLFYGAYNRTDSFWENTPMQAEGVPDGDELAFLETYRDRLPPEVFTEPAVTPYVSTTTKTDRRAQRQALSLLSEAGWTTGSDGIMRNAKNERLSIEFVSDSPAFDRIILPFIENLKSIGIAATYETVDPAEMEQRQEDFDYDMTVTRLVLPLSPSVELRSIFGSQSLDEPGSFNLSGLADPVVDDMIDQAIRADSREQLDARVRALDRVLRSKHIWVPNWFKGAHWIAYWDVFGKPDKKPAYARGDDYWWFDQTKFDDLKAQGALR